MKLALLSGSPRPNGGASKKFLGYIEQQLGDSTQAVWLDARKDAAAAAKTIFGCDALCIAAPLYIDSIPAFLLAFLERLESPLAALGANTKVYAVVNCGFYEPRQNATALLMYRRWAERAGLRWGSGLGIGGGEMAHYAPAGAGPNAPFGLALRSLAKQIAALQSGDDVLVKPGLPRDFYRLGGSASWVIAARKNKLRRRDLYRRAADYGAE